MDRAENRFIEFSFSQGIDGLNFDPLLSGVEANLYFREGGFPYAEKFPYFLVRAIDLLEKRSEFACYPFQRSLQSDAITEGNG